MKADKFNAAHYSTGAVAASSTSTAVEPSTYHEAGSFIIIIIALFVSQCILNIIEFLWNKNSVLKKMFGPTMKFV